MLATLGSLGDLHPIVGLALGLQARGHGVRIATSEFYRARIEGAGLEFSLIRPLAEPDDPQILRRVLHPWKGPEYLIRTLLLPHLRDMYDDLLRATEDADFLISGEVVVAAPLVAEIRRLPWAAAILAPFSFFSAYDPPVLPQLPFAEELTRAPAAAQKLILAAMKWATRRWGEPIQELRGQLGLRHSEHPILLDRYSPILNLALFADVLGSKQPDWPPNTVQCGFIFYDQPETAAANAPLDAFLARGPEPITFTLGSTAVMDAGRFFDESTEAARMLGRRAVLLMGRNPLPAAGSNQLFATEYAPYSQVFPRSACAVHQGGVGTTAQALRAGIPQLIMPYAFDQPDNAARVVRLGAGLSLARRRYHPPAAAACLSRLLTDPRFNTRARRVAERISAGDGVRAACDAIERVLYQSAGGNDTRTVRR